MGMQASPSCAVIIPIGPGHQQLASQAAQSVTQAINHNKGPFSKIVVFEIDDTLGKLGRSRARNKAVQRVNKKGIDWVFFLDADDYMMITAFKDVTPFIQKYDAIWGAIATISKGETQPALRFPQYPVQNIRQLVVLGTFNSIQIGHFVRTRIAANYPFDTNLDTGEDIDYYLRIWEKEKCLKISDRVLFVNRRGFHSRGPRSATGREWNIASEKLRAEYFKKLNINTEEALKIQTEACMKIKKDLKDKNLITRENYFGLARSCPTFGFIRVDCFHGDSFTMINNNDDSVVSSIIWLDGFEDTSVAIWSVLSRNAQVIYDIGAYTGLYSLVAGANHASAEIAAFEPLSDNYTRLVKNVGLNKFSIHTFNMALSDTTGRSSINIFSDQGFLTSGGSLLEKWQQVKRSEDVELNTIDNLVSEFVIGHPDLIKIDVEGAEINVLRGMQDVFNQGYRPDFLMEILDENTGAELTAFLTSLGYGFYQILESQKKLLHRDSLTGNGDLNALNNLVTTKTAKELGTLLESINIDITA